MGEEVHLGLPGPWAEDYREKADHYTTKIGGLPDWPTGDMSSSIEPHLLKCSLCGTKLCLVAQVYAPVAKLNIENRTIYVLVCPTPKCGPNPQSWKVLRVQKCHRGMQTDGKVDESDQIKENVCSAEPSSSCPDKSSSVENKSHEDSIDDFDLDDLANALEQAATLASNSKKKNKSKRANAPKGPVAVVKDKIDDPSLPVLPCFYIYYDKEQLRGKVIVGSSSSDSVLVKEIDGVANDEEEKWEGESYEYDKAIGADRTFLKFKKRMDAYPQQCFRYSYGGKPLSAAASLPDCGTCRLCGSPCQYELQLMSPLSYFLHEAGHGSSDYAPDCWTWMTLIIYTCSESCCPSICGGKTDSCCWGVTEEKIMTQEDEVIKA